MHNGIFVRALDSQGFLLLYFFVTLVLGYEMVVKLIESLLGVL